MHLAVLIPVFNDWIALSQLVGELDRIDLPNRTDLSLIVVDDGSSDAPVIGYPVHTLRRFRNIEIITLACNLGHQRAIAVGLVEAYRRKRFDAVLVMDSDGEDRPSDISRLVAEAVRYPGHVICAQRQHRPGLLAIRMWYEFYKFVFHLLTGARIDFGNFCLIPAARLESLVSNSSVWNNLAGTLTRSRLPLVSLPSDRGRRYAGTSKMNFVSLVMHGLSAMAVYSDVVMVRLLLTSFAVSALTAVGIVVVVCIKLFSALAIPGWATSAAGILVIIMVQALMLFTIAAFNMMSTRSMKSVIPLLDAPSFVLSRRVILPSELTEAAE
jgi:glycosyltransferase involved in cell wall biosynthesis